MPPPPAGKRCSDRKSPARHPIPPRPEGESAALTAKEAPFYGAEQAKAALLPFLRAQTLHQPCSGLAQGVHPGQFHRGGACPVVEVQFQHLEPALAHQRQGKLPGKHGKAHACKKL